MNPAKNQFVLEWAAIKLARVQIGFSADHLLGL
jgi:hypothetical protein